MHIQSGYARAALRSISTDADPNIRSNSTVRGSLSSEAEQMGVSAGVNKPTTMISDMTCSVALCEA